MMIKTDQSEFEEVELEKNGKWSPKAVFRIVYLNDVLSVEMKLESTNDGWQYNKEVEICVQKEFINPLTYVDGIVCMYLLRDYVCMCTLNLGIACLPGCDGKYTMVWHFF